MLFTETHYNFMHRAIQEAVTAFEEDEVPVGAVIVYKNRIIGRGYNRNEALQDPTAHAEIIALTAAANALGTNKLNECDIYVTLEPCVMCTGALLLARIRTCYFGAFDSKYGACGSLYNIPQENKYNHKMEVFSGLEEDACKTILQQFFQKKRSN